jgi:hypothetical protein
MVMPSSSSDRDLLRRIYRDLADEALSPESPFYEPVFDVLGLEDPVETMSTLIDFDGLESIRLFSGFRGSGKTTQLRRLQQVMERQGYFVLYADALEYVNAAEPIEITELLMAMAGAFSDALEHELGKDIARESFWTRIWTFLNSEVSFKEAGLKLEGAPKTGVDLKFELRAATSFREKLQKQLAPRLKELKDQVDIFFEDGVKLIRKSRGEDVRVVFIFDQLEQLRGTAQTEEIVIRSVERIFSIHSGLLKIPYVHTVFTAPPWLKFVLPGTIQITLLSTIHLWNNDESRSPCAPAREIFHSLVKRRLGEEGLQRLFGAEPAQLAALDRIIDVCGGHYRDLMIILRRIVIRATSLAKLPIPESLVEGAISATRRDFLPIAQDDAKWLDEIGRVRETALPSATAEPVNRLARFLDNHFVLYFVNGDEWYDIHPLIRDEVKKVVAASGLPAND